MARKNRPSALRERFEEALVAEPDEPAHHAAYADWLYEQDDPADRAWGEVIATQIALEDESRSAEQRPRLQQRESEWLAAHQREWLGELAPFLLDEHPLQGWATLELPAETPQATFRFRRGWLDRLHINSLPLS